MLTLPGTARGGVVSTEDGSFCPDGTCKHLGSQDGMALRFVGEAGERNTVTIRRTADAIELTDSSAPLRAEGRCSSVASGMAHCPLSRELIRYQLDGGDGDDRITVAGDVKAFRAWTRISRRSRGASVGAGRSPARARDTAESALSG